MFKFILSPLWIGYWAAPTWPFFGKLQIFAPFQQFETKATASFDLGSIHIWRQMILAYFLPTYPGAPPARRPRPGKLRPPDRCILFCKIKVRPRSCRSYPIWRPWTVQCTVWKPHRLVESITDSMSHWYC